jgi:hypothetical protein
MAAFQNKLHYVFTDRDGVMHHSFTADGVTWSAPGYLNQRKNYSAGPPALTVYNGRLYCIHRGGYQWSDNRLWWMSTSDGVNWSADTAFPQHRSESFPGVAVFRNRLYCVYRGGGSDRRLRVACTDGDNRWSNETLLPAETESGVSAIVYQGLLYAFYTSIITGKMYYLHSEDGQMWSAPKELPNVEARNAPALTTFGDRLLCMHFGNNDDYLWVTSTTNGKDWAKDKIVSNVKGFPAAAVFAPLTY